MSYRIFIRFVQGAAAGSTWSIVNTLRGNDKIGKKQFDRVTSYENGHNLGGQVHATSRTKPVDGLSLYRQQTVSSKERIEMREEKRSTYSIPEEF